MGNELKNIHVNVNGPTLAEVLPGLSFRSNSTGGIIVDWNGKINGKNDMVVIEVKTSDIVAKFK